MEKITRRGLLVSGAAMAVGALGSTAAEAATGSIYLKIVSAGFIFGVTGGEGVLTFNGVQYPLSLGGLSAGLTAGLAGTELIGSVSHINAPSDINGIYSKIGADISIAGGASVQRLRNTRGVLLKLHGKQVGFMFSIDLSGLSLNLK
jgi:hypothetical protein